MAQKIGAHTSRERAYIASAATFFQDRPRLNHTNRIRAYSRKVAAIHRDYPADADAAAFYALSLIALANENVDQPAKGSALDIPVTRKAGEGRALGWL